MKDNLVNESGGLVNDCISRQAAIDALDIGCELLRRVLDDTDVVGVERAKYEWGLGLIESYIADIKELPSAQPEIIRCKDCENLQTDWKPQDSDGYYCAVMDRMMEEDGFCSHAERKENVQ